MDSVDPLDPSTPRGKKASTIRRPAKRSQTGYDSPCQKTETRSCKLICPMTLKQPCQ